MQLATASYEVLPQVLLSLTELSGYGERMANRSGNMAWISVGGRYGEYESAVSTVANSSYDLSGFNVNIGIDIPLMVSADSTTMASVWGHYTDSSADISDGTAEVGNIEVEGRGIGGSVTYHTNNLYVDIQGMINFYDLELTEGVENDEVEGMGYGVGIDFGSLYGRVGYEY